MLLASCCTNGSVREAHADNDTDANRAVTIAESASLATRLPGLRRLSLLADVDICYHTFINGQVDSSWAVVKGDRKVLSVTGNHAVLKTGLDD